MKLNLDKLSDKEYMIGVFNDLDNMFVDIDAVWDQDSDKIGDWLIDHLKDEVKESMGVDEDLKESLKTLMDGMESFKDIYDEWYGDKLYSFNKDVVQVMIDAIGSDTFKQVAESGFKASDEDIVSMLDLYKEETTFQDLCSQIGDNMKSMAEDPEYFKKIADDIFTSSETTEGEVATDSDGVKDSNTPTTENDSKTGDETPVIDSDQKPVEDSGETKDPTDNVKSPEDQKPVTDGLNFATEASEESWDGNAAFAACTEVMDNSVLPEADFQALIDEVFAVVRGYDKQEN